MNDNYNDYGCIVTMKSSPAEKIRLMSSMFYGRRDVFARRYERKDGRGGYAPLCSNEWVRGVCGKCAKVKGDCATCAARDFMPISDKVFEWHLRGVDDKGKPFTMGVYPMLEDDTVRFAAIDFDKASWRGDVNSTIQVLKELGLPVVCERSRSGNGAHLWFFFSEPISAEIVRDVLSFIIAITMERNPSMGFDSYDRIFPCQNRLPKGGFGNLIALPLQGGPRKAGNSLFVDERLVPYYDQWEFLSRISMITREQFIALRSRACSEKRQLIPQTDEEVERNEPWSLFGVSSKAKKEEAVFVVSSSPIRIVLGNAIYISQDDLPPVLRGRLLRLAAFVNPRFREADWMRRPVYGLSRVVSRGIDGEKFVVLPRGLLDAVIKTLKEVHAKWKIEDKRFVGSPICCEFNGELRLEQMPAAKALIAYDSGVLAAGTAFGKTVLAAWMIGERKINTLILVNKKPLMTQWVERLSQFLNIPQKEIGVWGGGKHKYTGKIDVALIQSLVRRGAVNKEIVGSYGQLIVDECHGVPAISFEAVTNAFTGRYILGLSATPVRRDGMHPIIQMQCGPLRHRVEPKRMATFEHFEHRVNVRLTGFESGFCSQVTDEKPSYSLLIEELIGNACRNEMIVHDVLGVISEGRSPVVLTERRKHLEELEKMLAGRVENLLVLHGGMGAKDIKVLEEKRASIPDTSPRVLLATGSYLGEGFDDARLDTLFLALPISWKGRLTQYAGRLHRRHAGKREVRIYDYADTNVQMFARMFNKRCAGYKALGYEIAMPISTVSGLPTNVSLIREKHLDEKYSETVRRILREGVSSEEIDLFLFAAEAMQQDKQSDSETVDDELARSAVERFFFRHLESLPETKGKFAINVRLPIPFGGNPDMEVDFVSEQSKFAIEIDGSHHFADRDAYRRDRRKDELLQENGYFILRFLADDVMNNLGEVMARVIRRLK